ncbi:diacylglycerol/lipid kinase family protein [Nocardiopsis mangrovi]|uniref:Diacylglycerol/lipid kinase family protein n=1 Tax=Nocardiopsis mangrovi TaxID=1179818 RepID=A0ABV9DU16_9ACTN
MDAVRTLSVRRGGGPRTAPVPAEEFDPEGRGVVAVVNPRSGDGPSALGGPGMAERIRAGLPRSEVVEFGTGDDLAALMDDAAGRCHVLAVAGGDGTVNAAAQAALRHDRPLLVIPGGSLDNFASTLGLGSAEESVAAYRTGTVGAVDVGTADGRLFLNTASLGAYPAVFDHRERLRRRMGRWSAFAVAAWYALRRAEPTDVVVNGRRMPIRWAFVGNGKHHTRALIPSKRTRLEDGLLDIRVLRAHKRYSRTRVVLDMLLGHWGLGTAYTQWRVPALTVSSPHGRLRLACDGETFDAGPEVTFAKIAQRLRVFHAPPRPRRGRGHGAR